MYTIYRDGVKFRGEYPTQGSAWGFIHETLTKQYGDNYGAHEIARYVVAPRNAILISYTFHVVFENNPNEYESIDVTALSEREAREAAWAMASELYDQPFTIEIA